MKRIKRKTIMMCLSAVLFLSACSNKTASAVSDNSNSQTDQVVVVLDEQFVCRSGMTAEELAYQFRNDAENIVGVEVKNNMVEVCVTEEQREYWKNTRVKLLGDVKRQFEALDSRNSMEFSEGFDKITLTCDRTMNAEDFVEITINAMLYCEMYQIFNTDENSYYVKVEVFNQENGKMVTSGDTNTAMTLKASDWDD